MNTEIEPKLIFEIPTKDADYYREIIKVNVELLLRQLLNDLKQSELEIICKQPKRFIFKREALKDYNLIDITKSNEGDWEFTFIDYHFHGVDHINLGISDLSLENKLTLIEIIENSL